MAMNHLEVSTTVEADKQIVLNCRHGEAVRHALVLLEGEIKPFTNEVSCEGSTNEIKLGPTQEDTALKVQNLSNSKATEAFIYHKGQCHRWPVVENRFKAFVKLDKGTNLLKVQCHQLHLEKELSISYEKQESEQRYIENHNVSREMYKT